MYVRTKLLSLVLVCVKTLVVMRVHVDLQAGRRTPARFISFAGHSADAHFGWFPGPDTHNP